MRDDDGSSEGEPVRSEAERSDGRPARHAMLEDGQGSVGEGSGGGGDEARAVGGKDAEHGRSEEEAILGPSRRARLKALSFSRPHDLYRFVDNESGRTVYIGITCNLKNRVSQHKCSSLWYSADLCLVSESYPSGRTAAEAEAIAIAIEKPRENKINPRIPPNDGTPAGIRSALSSIAHDEAIAALTCRSDSGSGGSKDVVLRLRCTDEERRLLIAHADRHGTTLSQVLREILREAGVALV